MNSEETIRELRNQLDTARQQLAAWQNPHIETQRLIDIKNLRFYAEMFRQHEWSTVVIHWGVFEQTLKEIADRIADGAQE